MTPHPDPSTRWVLRNATRRPVELQLPTGVKVLAPRETIDLRDAGPTCAALEKQGVLTRHARRAKSDPAPKAKADPKRAGASPPAKPAAASAVAAGTSTAKSSAAKSSEPKPRGPRSRASKKKRSRKPDGGSE